ncbi:MAG: YitT family protein [Firmicutes bacterium]|nr:YitT family protein [Bacillota bacterium]
MNKIKEYVYITFAMGIVAVAVYFFLGPSQLAIGSVAGLAYVLSHFIPLPVSIITLSINVFLLVIGIVLIGKEFGAKTIYTTILISVYLAIFEKLFPNVQSLTQSGIYDALLYSIIVALGQAMLFKTNASSGGLDIVAKILNKYTPLDLGTSVTLAGMSVAASSLLVYDLGTMIISMFWTYANGLIIDSFIDGFNRKKRVCIISDDYDRIREYVLFNMKRGVSMVKVIGGYDQKEKMELQSIMTKYEYKRLLNFLEKEQIQAFITISTTNEVIGIWNQKR